MSLLEPPQEILQILRESLPDDATSSRSEEESSGTEDVLAYVAFLAAGLCDSQEFTPSVWEECLRPYLSKLVASSDCDEPVNAFREAAQKATIGDDDEESYGDHDDEGFEEIANIRFNLAYGGKILLHQTKLRLLRGRRYALVG